MRGAANAGTSAEAAGGKIKTPGTTTEPPTAGLCAKKPQ
jgi:hypothetical protein